MAQNNCCLVNLVVHRTKVFAQFEVLHEPIIGANFAIFDVLRACIQGFVSDAPCIKVRFGRRTVAESENPTCGGRDPGKVLIFKPILYEV